MVKSSLYTAFLVFMFACTTFGQATQTTQEPQDEGILSPATTTGESGTHRVIAIGDIHGDYQQFVKILRAVGVVDKRNRWSGGKTHLVQLGDIPDRGPDSRKAMDLLMKLETSSVKDGGAVTVLIGNHEAMMMTDDLRYVHPGEYASFKDRNSKARRKAYYQQTIDHIKKTTIEEEWPVFDKAHRSEWEKRFPLGYVEHRMAWAATGKYGKWVLSHPAIAQIDDTLFLHGGLSNKYSSMSIAEINTRVRTELADPNSLTESSLIEDPEGPLWHRGWAQGIENDANQTLLEDVLAAHNAKRMVVAHTPLTPVVLPRFGGKLLIVDVGLSAHYGSGFSALEIIDGKPQAILKDKSLSLPIDSKGQDDYLQAAAELVGDRSKIDNYIALLEKARAEELQRQTEKAAGAN